MNIQPRLGTWVVYLALTATLYLGVAYGVGPVFANGGSRPLVTSARSGPYELQIGVLPGSPKVGDLHLSIQLTDAGGGPPITDAAITLAATGPDGAEDVPPVRAMIHPHSPEFYDADIHLDTAGNWILTVETRGGLGDASLDVPFEVSEADGIDIVLILAGGVALLAAGLWLFDRMANWRKRRAADA
jgi:hypothetical protein